MKRLYLFPALLLGAACALAAAPADDKPQAADAPADDAHDFVYFGDTRPVLLGVHVEMDGRPLDAAWNDFVNKVFKHLDADGDGVLSKEEAAKAPPIEVLFNGAQGAFRFAAPPAPAVMESDKDGKVGRDQLAAYYRRNGGAPVQFQSGPALPAGRRGQVVLSAAGGAVSADAINDAFFRLLDTNKDGKLSREELAKAPEVLMKLDLDDDEVVTLEELMPLAAGPPTFGVVIGQALAPSAGTDNFVMVAPGESGANLARQLRDHYGPKGAKKLTRKDLGLDQKAFDLLDADQDGELDGEELARFAQRPADLELKVRLGKKTGRDGAIEVIEDGKNPSPLAKSVQIPAGGPMVLDLGSARLNITTMEEGRGGAPREAIRQQYLAQFKAADRDNNGYLDEKEAMASPFFRNTFKAMDRDGDGKLFEKEVLAYLDAMADLQDAARLSCATVSFADQGRGLFDLVDTNHDGRLSLREMRQMVKLIDQLDKDGDGQISRAEIVRNYQLTFRQGPGGGGLNTPFVVAFPGGAPFDPRRPAPSAGPLWFRKMDRNHDGDVSRREFLGTDEEFNRLDADGDGLISVEEAERADKLFRKGKE